MSCQSSTPAWTKHSIVIIWTNLFSWPVEFKENRCLQIFYWELWLVLRKLKMAQCPSKFSSVFFFSGWQILVQEKEEQHGSKAFSWCTAAEGEPDHSTSLLSGAGKCCTKAASGWAEEGLWSLQEHPGPIWGEVRPSVKSSEQRSISETKAELPSPQNSTQTQTPRESKFALLSLLTSSHCV